MVKSIKSVKKAHILYVILSFFFLSVHAQKAEIVSYKKNGTDSFYNKKFKGKKTTSGERLDNDKYTAAHPTIPFGTLVRVTNLRNGKSVVVKINDRFSPKKSHLIDITYTAAKDIDMVGQGIANVTVEVIGNPEKDAVAELSMSTDTITWYLPAKEIDLQFEKPVSDQTIVLR